VNEREMVCRQLVEVVTDYLEGALDEDFSARVEEHMVVCEPCAVYLEQMKLTSAAVGAAAGGDAVPPQQRSALMLAFRDWSRT
jgi:predicted anti-sigma-YlaC factor YlaD